jgi:formylglycine-generating enzyme
MRGRRLFATVSTLLASSLLPFGGCSRYGEADLVSGPDAGKGVTESDGGGGGKVGDDAGADGASAVQATSCVDAAGPGIDDCGENGSEDCCASLVVPGGPFLRSNDSTATATVSAFRLDRYEVTVARFRRFVEAVVGGWQPAEGSGKHVHLSEGNGLASGPNGAGLGFEAGWQVAQYGTLSTSPSTWTTRLQCGGAGQTWTAAVGANESLPLTCLDWVEAYAFCIWDGGFLPSEAEWNHAAAGGSEQREFAWGTTSVDCTRANYGACDGTPNRPGSKSPSGDGRWGHADLTGNVWEWILDWHATTYATPCSDCANLTPAATRGQRGGGFEDLEPQLKTSFRGGLAPTTRWHAVGFRCTRTP